MGLSSLLPSDGPIGGFLGLSFGIYVEHMGTIKSIT